MFGDIQYALRILRKTPGIHNRRRTVSRAWNRREFGDV